MNKVERLIKNGWWLKNGVWVKDCPFCGELKMYRTKCRCGKESDGKEKI